LDGGGGGQAKPDVYPASTTFNNTTAMKYNDFILVNVTVANKGNASTANPVEVYCYIDNVLQSQNETQGALGPAPPVNTSDLFCNFTAPGAGMYLFNVSTSIKPQVDEWNYTNNNISMWIFVYAKTQITPVLINSTTPTRGEGLNITARLIFTNGTAIIDQNLTFTDEADSINMGSDLTNLEGYAEIEYSIPSAAEVGVHTVNVTYDANNTIYSYSSNNESVSFSIFSTANISLITASGQIVHRGNIIELEALVLDSVNGSKIADYPCKFYDGTTLLYTNSTNSTGHCIYEWDTTSESPGLRTVQANITDNSSMFYFADSPDDVDSISLTINDLPTITAPVFNNTTAPAEFERIQDIEISCDVGDTEDLVEDLTVTIDLQYPLAAGWTNETSTTNISNTFYRNYSTDSGSLLGDYTAVCSATDTEGARIENSSTFLLFANANVTIELNATDVGYGDIVNVSGQAFYIDTGYVTSSDAVVKLNSITKCTDTTDSDGGYSCYFSAPNNVGIYTVSVEVTDMATGKLFTNSTSLTVSVIYGEEEAVREEAADVGCYEVPRLIQNPDGSIERVTVKICVWE